MYINIIKILLLLSFIMGSYRLYKGPSLADRIVALDTLANIAAAFVILQLFITGKHSYIDIVIVISLIVFLGTIAFSIHLRKRNKKK